MQLEADLGNASLVDMFGKLFPNNVYDLIVERRKIAMLKMLKTFMILILLQRI